MYLQEEMTMETHYQSGDIFFTKGTSWFARAIRFFSRTGGESKTEVNHVGMVVVPGTVEYAEIVEALSTVKRRRFRVYKNKKTLVAVYRPRLPFETRSFAGGNADRYVGRKYGWIKIIAHFLDWCIGGRYFFRRFAFMDRYPICSWVVAYAYNKAGYSFGIEPGAASPDDIWDYIQDHPDEFVCVRELGVLT